MSEQTIQPPFDDQEKPIASTETHETSVAERERTIEKLVEEIIPIAAELLPDTIETEVIETKARAFAERMAEHGMEEVPERKVLLIQTSEYFEQQGNRDLTAFGIEKEKIHDIEKELSDLEGITVLQNKVDVQDDDQFKEHVKPLLDSTDVGVVALTFNSLADPNVLKQLKSLQAQGKPIIPVVIGEIFPPSVNPDVYQKEGDFFELASTWDQQSLAVMEEIESIIAPLNQIDGRQFETKKEARSLYNKFTDRWQARAYNNQLRKILFDAVGAKHPIYEIQPELEDQATRITENVQSSFPEKEESGVHREVYALLRDLIEQKESDRLIEIFFSHARADFRENIWRRPFGKDFDPIPSRMEAFLKSGNRLSDIKIWRDIEGIKGGEDFQRRIRTEIEQKQAGVVMLSREAIFSRWVLEEIRIMQELNKPIVLVQVEDIPGTADEIIESLRIKNAEKQEHVREFFTRINQIPKVDMRDYEVNVRSNPDSWKQGLDASWMRENDISTKRTQGIPEKTEVVERNKLTINRVFSQIREFVQAQRG